MPINIYELHDRMTKHLFPAFSSTDEEFLSLAICGECGELANMIKKQWRDGVDLTADIREEIADIRVYLELIAKCFDLEGEKLNRRLATAQFPVIAFNERIGAMILCVTTGKMTGRIVARMMYPSEEVSAKIYDDIVALRYWLERTAEWFGIGGDKLDEQVQLKLQKVVAKAEAKEAAKNQKYRR